MIEKYITRNVSLKGSDVEQKMVEIKEYFLKTYELFEKLFDIFVDDSVFLEQPEKLRHKLIFYFGHTATFYINKLILGKFITNRINPHFESIFAIGVDEMSWDDLNDENYDWPSASEVRAYRQTVKNILCEYIDTVEFTLPITRGNPLWAIMMGIEHERIHIETSSVLHRQLDIKFIKQIPLFEDCKEFGQAPVNELLEVKGAKVKLGKDFKDDYYSWDNEYGSATFEVNDFKASKYLVSNGEFLEFVEDGGYETDSYWDDEGLRWRNFTKATHPTFWIKDKDGFRYRTMTNIIPLPLNWPVDVNCLEAMAFCRYKSEKLGQNITLPTEAMWYRIHEVSGVKDAPFWEDKVNANINLEYFCSASPVDMFAHGKFYDVIGNVWQWTSTAIDGFKGFKIDPLYDDFSLPTFDNRHNLIKGGSFISTGNETLLSARYAFRRHFFQHAGFRYVEVDSLEQNDTEVVTQEIYFEDEEFFDEVFAVALKYIKDGYTKCLNLGCDYGKLTLNICDSFNETIGIDLTARNILIAQTNLDIIQKEYVEFWQGDSCNLKPHFKDFDMIVATNKYDELYDKNAFVNILKTRLKDDGILVVKFRNLEDNHPIKMKLSQSFKLIDEIDGVMIWQK